MLHIAGLKETGDTLVERSHLSLSTLIEGEGDGSSLAVERLSHELLLTCKDEVVDVSRCAVAAY